MLGSTPRGSDSVNQGRAREFAWLTAAPLTWMLLAWGPPLENHRPHPFVSQVGTMLTTKPGDPSPSSPSRWPMLVQLVQLSLQARQHAEHLTD